ncbi:hypothetical protein [Bradyrhizobium diazoefficiens]
MAEERMPPPDKASPTTSSIWQATIPSGSICRASSRRVLMASISSRTIC